MAKIHRNGDVLIRLADIVAAHITDEDTQIVEIILRSKATFRFRCSSTAEAKQYINSLAQEIEKD